MADLVDERPTRHSRGRNFSPSPFLASVKYAIPSAWITKPKAPAMPGRRFAAEDWRRIGFQLLQPDLLESADDCQDSYSTQSLQRRDYADPVAPILECLCR